MTPTREARIYRDAGLSPLPSLADKKRPSLPSYAEYRAKSLEERFFLDWPAPNIQLMTGVAAYGDQKILVVDCDGQEASQAWRRIASSHGPLDYGWLVKTGGNGEHWYFRIPPGVKAVTTGLIWGLWDTYGDAGLGRWVKHKEIKILGDGALAIAPPSRHVDTGAKYEFIGFNPLARAALPEAPEWLVGMPRLTAPRIGAPKRAMDARRPSGESCRQAVLDAMDDKAATAAAWGLRFASVGPNASGWMRCHAVDREDSTPSCAFHAESGVYKDFGSGATLSLFDLAVALGAFKTWCDALRWSEAKYLIPHRESVAVGITNGRV